MSAADPLFCFTSNTIEIHSCPNCRAPMTLVSGTSSRSNSEVRRFQCFNCDSAYGSSQRADINLS
jgi:transposase-like protein